MDGSTPQQTSPLLLQLSNTASNEARRHWLLEKRLTAPLPDTAPCDGYEPPARTADARAEEQQQALPAQPAKRARLAVTVGLPGGSLAVQSEVQSAAFPVGTARGHALGAGLQQRLVSAADLCPAPGNDAAAQELKAQIARLQEALSSATEQAARSAARCQQLELDVAEYQQASASSADRMKQCKQALIQLAKTCADWERAQKKRSAAQEGSRLGCVMLQRVGVSIQEVWEDGAAFSNNTELLRAVTRAREDVELARKAVKRRIAPPGTPADLLGAGSDYVTPEEFLVAEEGFKVRMAGLRKEEDALTRERERLERDKACYVRELKRIRDEEASRFNKFPVLGGRYVLQNLLGRGGFSEVFKAYDIEEMRYVACKIHQLVPHWSEDHKRSYVRHAAREYSIMKRVQHDSIVRLLDVFEIDDDCFCTVLELCEGNDLDVHLKTSGTLPEREARVIMAQIFAGLAYLSSAQRRVVHYDLKPGNVLFDATGRVKITDFGLSKIMEETGTSEGLELTSQGAGTYWYLPPECFQTGANPPKISSKVDVWSAGVVFFQLLYGKRPFGHDLTQESILRDETILRSARSVTFPDKPAVSAEAKAFIRRCLTYTQADRPDVQQAAADPYLSYAKQAAASRATPS